MNLTFIKGITLKLAIINGIIVCLFYLVLKSWGRKKALNKIKKDLSEDEYIVYEPQLNFTVELIFPFIIGAAFGAYILPFFIYPEIQKIDMVSRNDLPIIIIFDFLLFCFLILFSFFKTAITNRRIIKKWTFEFLNKHAKTLNLKFSEINYLEIKWYFFLKSLNVWLKDGSYINFIGGFKNLEKIKAAIKENISEVNKV